MVYKSSSIAAGGSSGTGGGSISDITSTGGTITIGAPTGPTTNVDVANNTTNTLAGYNNSGVFSDVSIGTNLNLISGVLSTSAFSAGSNVTINYSTNTIGISASGGGAVSSVFSRTGAVTADWGDYAFNLIAGVAGVSQGGTGLQTLTAHSVLLGEGVGNVSFATTGIVARILIDQGNTDPSFQVLTGDSSLTSNGVMVNTAVHGVTYPSSPSTGFVPVVTGANTVTYEFVPNSSLLNSSVTVSGVSGVTGGGMVALGSSITLGMADSIANTLAGYNSSGVFSDVSIGSNLSLSGGVLNGTVGPATITSVFGRTGAVSANYNDYNFNLIGGTASVSQGGTGLQTLTSHAVLLGEGIANVSFATTGTAARILIDQGVADPAFKTITGDVSFLSTGATTVLAVHGVTYPASPSTNTVPVVTGTNTVTYETVPNAALTNSAITIGAQTGLSGGGSVALGSAITLSMGTGTANTLAGYNSSGVFADVSIGTNLNLVGGVLGTSNISGGTSIAISYSTNTLGITYTGSATGVSTITNTDGSLTISPQTGVVQASLNVSHANTWTATQTGAVSGGAASLISQGCIEFSIFANGNSGSGTPTLKWANGNIQSVTITGACTLGFTLPTNPGRLTVISTMSATTGFPYTYAGTVLWPGGTIPTYSSISNAKDITSFLYDGTSVYGIGNINFLT